MHGGVRNDWVKCQGCGRDYAFNLRTQTCSIISCKLHYKETGASPNGDANNES